MSATDAMIDAMLRAQIDAAAERKPLREKRMHPDDLAELRRRVPPVFDLTASSMRSFNGIRIIEDRDAERLPRV